MNDPTFHWRMAQESHVGQVRVRNEDYVFCDEARGIVALADGISSRQT